MMRMMSLEGGGNADDEGWAGGWGAQQHHFQTKWGYTIRVPPLRLNHPTRGGDRLISNEIGRSRGTRFV